MVIDDLLLEANISSVRISSAFTMDTPEIMLHDLEFKWRISNWVNKKRDKKQIMKESYSISTSEPILSKWKIGLLEELPAKGSSRLIYTLTLLELESSLCAVQAIIEFSLEDREYNTKFGRTKGSKFVKVNEVNLITEGYGIPTMGDWTPGPGYILDDYGTLQVDVKLTLILPSPPTKRNFAETALRTKTFYNFKKNQLALLNEDGTSDIKIVASDNVEFMAHKLILQAQCPVFASMFRSQFAETTNGIIQVNDLCGKVINILLSLFYTGELEACWSDPDVIVEFTYSAGKYQLTDILNMLDNVLGDHDNGKDYVNDVQLLSLVHKLSLQKAEKRLLERIKKNVTKCSTAAGLFNMFGFQVNENLLEKEKAGEVLELWQETLNGPTKFAKNAGHRHILLLNYAKSKGLKEVESVILRRVISTIQDFNTADELFAIFDCGKTDVPDNETSSPVLNIS